MHNIDDILVIGSVVLIVLALPPLSLSLLTFTYPWLFPNGSGASHSLTHSVFPTFLFPEFTLTVGLSYKITFSIWLCPYENDVRWVNGVFKGARLAWDPLSKCPSTNPPLNSCGLVSAEATGELRKGKFSLNWRSATVLGCNDFTNIFKQRTRT